MQKKSILFVDDEPNILSGLKRMLRSLRKYMELNFAGSGQDALKFLEQNKVDVIVTDMRMPNMDGATLLKEVQQKHPRVMRIILSGHAEQSSILQTVGVAHQFLAKPTSAEVLKDVLNRACCLQDMMGDESLREFASKVGSLPSLPTVYGELQEILKNPETSVEEVGLVIEKDMAMSVKVLQLVNSAFFGLYNNIESPARAVNLLGIDTIKALVLNVGVFTEIGHGVELVNVEKLWKHSLRVALFAKYIAQHEEQDEDSINHIFIAGLLHDIGKLLFYVHGAADYEKVIAEVDKRPIQCHIAEKEVFRVDHALIGGYLLGLWGMPGPVIEAVAFHHSLSSYPGESFCPALAIHVADVIACELQASQDFEKPLLEQNYLSKIGFLDKYEKWYEECIRLERNFNGEK